MAGEADRSRWGTFLLGGLIGGLAGFAASHLRSSGRSQRHLASPGLAAFEQAPCFAEAERAADDAADEWLAGPGS